MYGVINDAVPFLTETVPRNKLVSNLHDLVAVAEEVEAAQKQGGVAEKASGGNSRGVRPEVGSSI